MLPFQILCSVGKLALEHGDRSVPGRSVQCKLYALGQMDVLNLTEPENT